MIDTLADHATTTAARDSDRLDAAATLLNAMDRIAAAVIAVLQAADHHQVIAAHGLTRDSWLRAVAGRTGADAGMLLAAAEHLADMPAVWAWFCHGALSWGAVRAIVLATRNLTGEQRAWGDATLAQDREAMLRLDGDQLVAAVDGLVDEAARIWPPTANATAWRDADPPPPAGPAGALAGDVDRISGRVCRGAAMVRADVASGA